MREQAEQAGARPPQPEPPTELKARIDRWKKKAGAKTLTLETGRLIQDLAAQLATVEARLGQATKLQRLTEDNEIAWMRKHEAVEAQLQEREAALQEMATELHAAINEPMYAGTRADWIWRAQKAEAERDTLKASLQSIRGEMLAEKCGWGDIACDRQIEAWAERLTALLAVEKEK
jgi:hypothetical protein